MPPPSREIWERGAVRSRALSELLLAWLTTLMMNWRLSVMASPKVEGRDASTSRSVTAGEKGGRGKGEELVVRKFGTLN